MGHTNIAKENTKELFEAQTHIWNHIYAYHHSMALKCAIELGIPDTIHKHGSAMTLLKLADSLRIPPNKTLSLYRLLRLLVHSNFFSMTMSIDGEETYDINTNSLLLLKHHPSTLVPYILCALDPVMTETPHHLSRFLKSEEKSPFHVVHGKSLWEHASLEPKLNQSFNAAMSSDAGFVSKILLANDDFNGMIKGLDSLVDVGGGQGTMAMAISGAYPGLKCIVLDLPHVVDGLQGNGRNLEYVAGDMFKKIPSADAVMLKWILHDWSDKQCVKILEKCKETIPSKGKIIIVDIVLNNPLNSYNTSENHFEAQLLWDMSMMANDGGKERTENEWKQLFFQAGLLHYNIYPILGTRSVIEVHCP